MNNEEQKKIERMKRMLYSRKPKDFVNKRKVLKNKNKKDGFKDDWETETFDDVVENRDLYVYNKKGPSIFSIILILSLIFFVTAISFAVFYLSLNKNSVSTSLNLSILGPDSVRSGDVVDFVIKLQNDTKLEYRDIEFLIDFPKSTIDPEIKNFVKTKNIETKEKLLPGGTLTEKFSAILSGSEGEKKDIQISIFYKMGNFSNTISGRRIYTIEIESAPINIELEFPTKVLSKKEFNLKINILSNNSEALNDLIIIATYPSGFKVIDSKPQAVFSEITKNIFKIEQLEAGEKKTIDIKGFLVGQNNENKFFKFEIGDSIPFRNEVKTIFAKAEKEVAIKKSDIGISVASVYDNENGESIVFAGDKVNLNINITNNSGLMISDMEMKALLKGDIFVPESINARGGFYNSNNNTILWNKNTDENFAQLKENFMQEREIDLRILDLEEIAGYFKDPTLEIDFDISGINFRNQDLGGEINETIKKIIKVATSVNFESTIKYNEGPFKNSGDINPIVGEPTTYTVEWKVFNSSSDISDVVVKAKLPLYVKYLNNIQPEKSYISYDPETREVTWISKKINAFTGYRVAPKKVYFQVEYIPTAPHRGSAPIIIEDISLTAQDTFTELPINKRVKDLSIRVKEGHNNITGEGSVQ